MSKSVEIIKNLTEENLIEAKKVTESYLNDILSQALRKEYQNVAPAIFNKPEEPTN